MSDVTKFEFGTNVMYKDRVVKVLNDRGGSSVGIQDGGRQFSVSRESLSAVPSGAPINSRNKIGVGSVIPKEIRSRYTQHKGVKTAGGSTAIDNCDDVATALRGKSLDEAYEFTVEQLKGQGVETTVEALKAKYSKLNVGMQRMNLGNVIRGAGRKLATQQKKDQAKAEREAKRAEAKAAKEAAAAQASEAPADAAPAEGLTRSDGTPVPPSKSRRAKKVDQHAA